MMQEKKVFAQQIDDIRRNSPVKYLMLPLQMEWLCHIF